MVTASSLKTITRRYFPLNINNLNYKYYVN